MVKAKNLDEMKSFKCPTNASVSELEYDNGIWEAKQISLDSHLKDFRDSIHAYA